MERWTSHTAHRIRRGGNGRGYYVEERTVFSDGSEGWYLVEYCFTLWGARRALRRAEALGGQVIGEQYS